jgi:hypothetical protein
MAGIDTFIEEIPQFNSSVINDIFKTGHDQLFPGKYYFLKRKQVNSMIFRWSENYNLFMILKIRQRKKNERNDHFKNSERKVKQHKQSLTAVSLKSATSTVELCYFS